MYSIRADLLHHRLLMSVSGRPATVELAALERETRVEVAKLRPGYVIAADLRGMGVLDQETAPAIAAVQKVMISGGPSKIGTLVGSTVLMMQLSRHGRSAGGNELIERFTDEHAWHEFLGF